MSFTETGTCNFSSPAAARRCYKWLMEGMTEAEQKKEIETKIKEGLIEIGPPNLKPGQTLRVVDGRYRIRE